MAETVFIYALCDPDIMMVRYVGKSSNVENRFSRHIHAIEKTYKYNWINSLKKQEKLPVLKILEETNRDSWEEAEKKWIAYYRVISGDKLTNTTEGGECGTQKGFRKGHLVSEETRIKIAEANRGRKQGEEEKRKRNETMRKFSTEVRKDISKKISEAMKNRIVSEETRKKLSIINKRKVISPQTRDKMTLSLRGFYKSNKSLATRQKMSEGHKNKALSEEHKRKISISLTGKSHGTGRKLSLEHRHNISEGGKGRKLSLETKNKMSESRKRFCENNIRKRVYDASGNWHYTVTPRNQENVSISQLDDSQKVA